MCVQKWKYKTEQKFFSHQDSNVRGYAVLVSEIMLQQTQVATVIQYYKYSTGILLKILNESSENFIESKESRIFAKRSVSQVRMRAQVFIRIWRTYHVRRCRFSQNYFRKFSQVWKNVAVFPKKIEKW